LVESIFSARIEVRENWTAQPVHSTAGEYGAQTKPAVSDAVICAVRCRRHAGGLSDGILDQVRERLAAGTSGTTVQLLHVLGAHVRDSRRHHLLLWRAVQASSPDEALDGHLEAGAGASVQLHRAAQLALLREADQCVAGVLGHFPRVKLGVPVGLPLRGENDAFPGSAPWLQQEVSAHPRRGFGRAEILPEFAAVPRAGL